MAHESAGLFLADYMNGTATVAGLSEQIPDIVDEFGVLAAQCQRTVLDQQDVPQRREVSTLPEVTNHGEQEQGLVDEHVGSGDTVWGLVFTPSPGGTRSCLTGTRHHHSDRTFQRRRRRGARKRPTDNGGIGNPATTLVPLVTTC